VASRQKILYTGSDDREDFITQLTIPCQSSFRRVARSRMAPANLPLSVPRRKRGRSPDSR
jgi:hypothetical protein